MPHQKVVIEALTEEYQVCVHSTFHKDNNNAPCSSKSHVLHDLRALTSTELASFIISTSPEFIVVAGWRVKTYVAACKKIRRSKDIPIIAMLDTQWRGSIRQQINVSISRLHLKRAFTHLWAAGFYQFEYARRLGFLKSDILVNSLSCDLRTFSPPSSNHEGQKLKNFLFVGRLTQVKGLKKLIKAWKSIEELNGWTLTIVGEGPLEEILTDVDGIIWKGFLSQDELLQEMNQASCFVLSSVFEPWAVVIHEAAASGLPIIATDVCGAVPHFLISGYNGIVTLPNSESIAKAMIDIMGMTPEKWNKYSERSRELARSISPELGAAQLMSVLH